MALCHSQTLCHMITYFYSELTWAGLERIHGVPPPWKITKLKSFSAILVRIPWKVTKLSSQNSMLGHHRHASETPFKWRLLASRRGPAFRWRADDGPLLVAFGSSLLSSTTPPPPQKKVKIGPPSDKTFWILAWLAGMLPHSAREWESKVYGTVYSIHSIKFEQSITHCFVLNSFACLSSWKLKFKYIFWSMV